MDIQFRTTKLQKRCNSLKEAQKVWGETCGKLVMRRLDEMLAADNLHVLRKVHRRCHALTGNREGQWSVDLEHPRRLVFEPANDPLPLCEDGSLDLQNVTIVRILEVGDTHG